MDNSTTLYVKEKFKHWFDYCVESWKLNGKPERLNPLLVFINPLEHNKWSYIWVEQKYKDEFETVFAKSTPGDFSSKHGQQFVNYWNLYFDPVSVWKQLRPLFIFSSALKTLNEDIIELGAAYIFGQGVPSMAVDKILDSLSPNTHSHSFIQSTLPFCLISYAIGVEKIQQLCLGAEYLEIFTHDTQLMYELMWDEFETRFKIPQVINQNLLDNYINGQSRLLSSVFFSITIKWAHIYANIKISDELNNMCQALRKVRQLNDEIADVQEDFARGLLSYPVLHTLTNSETSERMKALINKNWVNSDLQNSDEKLVMNEFRELLDQSNSLKSSARKSIDLLEIAINYIMNAFQPEDAFEITLLINQRISFLIRMANNNWHEVAGVYYPEADILLGKPGNQ